ncbi:MAG: hypothetical protein JXR83_02070 [Deltaproteobacteria bacterium]|nr:hypothetical protein [Deltaproteobacteria bacterium]
MTEDTTLPPAETSAPGAIPRWLVRLSQPGRMAWLAPLIALVLTLPSVLSGYTQDDHVFRQSSLETTIFPRRAAWDYFHWVDSPAEIARFRERGIQQVTWWTPDTARSRFLRPLSSLLHAFEFNCFGDAPWLMHVICALLYAAIVFLGVKLLARFSSTAAAAGIACLLFAVDDAHAYSAGWISSNNTLLTFAFGLFALLMHDRWRREKSVLGLVLSLAGLVFSLLSSEGGLALIGYLAAYALFLDSGSWHKRIATLVPAALVAVGYLIFYFTQGLGIRGSFDWLSPTEDLVQTALVVLSGAATGTIAQVSSIPMLALLLQGAGIWGPIAAALLLAALAALFWRFLRSSRRVGFFAAGMVLSLVPFSVGMMGDRYLLWAGLGGAGLMAELFAVWATTSRLQRVVARALLVTQVHVSAIVFVPTLFWLAAIENNIRKTERMVAAQDTVMLNGSTIADNASAGLRYEKQGQWPEHFYHLYEGMDALTVKRVGERTLLMTPANGWFATSWISRGARPKELVFGQGQVFEMELMTAKIEKMMPDGRPRSVSFAFKKDLSELAWLAMTFDGPSAFQVPAPGEEVVVALWGR